MAISAVGTDAAANGSASPLSVSYPSGGHPCDIALLQVCSNSTVTTPTGYTLLNTQNVGSGRLYLYARYLDGSEAATVSITFASTRCAAALSIRRGTFASVTANISMLVPDSATASSTTPVSPPALREIPSGAWLEACAGVVGTNSSAATCTLTGTNWTKKVDTGNGSASVDAGICTAINSTDTGTANQPTFTFSASQANLAAVTFYLVETTLLTTTTAVLSNSATGTLPAGTSLGLPSQTTWSVGDIIVVAVATNGGSAVTAPAGWTALDSPNASTASFYKIWTLADFNAAPVTLTFSWTGSVVAAYCWLDVSSYNFGAGVVTATISPVIEAHAANQNASSTSITAPTSTPEWPFDLLVNVYFSRTAAGAIVIPGNQTAGAANNANSMSVAIGSEALHSNNATSTRTATGGAAAVNYGFSMVFRSGNLASLTGRLMPCGDNFNDLDPFRKGVSSLSGVGANKVVLLDSVDKSVAPDSVQPHIKNSDASVNSRAAFLGTGTWPIGFNGNYKIVGVAYDLVNQLIPLPNVWVYLYPCAAPSLCIAAAYTDASGNYSFSNIAPGSYIVIGHDPSATYQGYVVDWVVAVSQ